MPSIGAIYKKIRAYFIKRETKKSIYVSDYDKELVCNLFLILEVLSKIYYKKFQLEKIYGKFLSIYEKWSNLKKRKIANFESNIMARQKCLKLNKCLCECQDGIN